MKGRGIQDFGFCIASEDNIKQSLSNDMGDNGLDLSASVQKLLAFYMVHTNWHSDCIKCCKFLDKPRKYVLHS
jgi:hypothetical protein